MRIGDVSSSSSVTFLCPQLRRLGEAISKHPIDVAFVGVFVGHTQQWLCRRSDRLLVALFLACLIVFPAFHVAGIGENGHLAFNDPPADFDTEVYC